MTKKDLIIKIKELYPYYKNLEKMKVSELKEIIDKKCNNILIKNENSSCYLDSLLVSLFHNDNEYIKNLFLNSPLNDFKNKKLLKIANEIRDELIIIYSYIQNINNDDDKNYCKKLRKLFQDFYNIKYPDNDINWKNDQLEPLDVINMFNEIFNIKKETKINIKQYGTEKITKTIIFKNLKLINDKNILNDFYSIISIDKLLFEDKLEIKKYYPILTEDTTFSTDNLWKPNSKENYIRKIEKNTFLSSPFLFIHINRNAGFGSEARKLDTKIIPTLKIKMKENDFNLYLKSIIIHHGIFGGGHYTTLYICNGKWYEYDDLKIKVKLVGDFDDLCKYNNEYYLKNCTNLLYFF
jgi:hypothetical protein